MQGPIVEKFSAEVSARLAAPGHALYAGRTRWPHKKRRASIARPRRVRRQKGTTVKRTFQPNTRRRAKKHGFRHRMSTRAGQAIIKARRRKGRHKLTA